MRRTPTYPGGRGVLRMRSQPVSAHSISSVTVKRQRDIIDVCE